MLLERFEEGVIPLLKQVLQIIKEANPKLYEKMSDALPDVFLHSEF